MSKQFHESGLVKVEKCGTDNTGRPVYVDTRISDKVNAVIRGVNYMASDRGLDAHAVRILLENVRERIIEGYPGT